MFLLTLIYHLSLLRQDYMFLLTLIYHLSLRGIVFLFQSALKKLHYPVRSFVNVDYSSLVDTINMESSVILLISIILEQVFYT